MNDQQQAAQLSSMYPLAPMDYVNMYTNENIKIGKAPPPPPIIKDNYTCFGKPIDPNEVSIRSLETQGIQRLYSSGGTSSTTTTTTSASATTTTTNTTSMSTNDHKKELKKLNHSILIAYLDLLDVLIKAPTKELPKDQQQIDWSVAGEQQTFKTLRDQKLEDIELLFINMHHLINELRPHQARDNIRCILEMQKKQRIETAQKFKTHLFKIVEILKLCIQSIQSSSSNKNNNNNNDITKSDVFIEELNSMMAKATVLTKHLDSIDLISNNNKKIKNKSDEITSTDVDMLQEDELFDNNNKKKLDFESSIKLINNNLAKNIEKTAINSQLLITTTTSTTTTTTNNNCDFKDLILCNLIDDFLLKENEF